jgi:hypothetical protein
MTPSRRIVRPPKQTVHMRENNRWRKALHNVRGEMIAGQRLCGTRFVTGHDFSRAEKVNKMRGL